MAMPLQHEYGCLTVRGYKTAETKKTAHLKNMRELYIVLYVTEGRLPRTGHCDLVDADGVNKIWIWCTKCLRV